MSLFLLPSILITFSYSLLELSCMQVKVSELENKVIGIYFSANWHPPCIKFTQVLSDVYAKLKSRNAGFEVVFVSSDEDVHAFDAYRASMPWPAIQFSDLERRKELNRRFGIEGIPALILIQPNNHENDAVVHNGVEVIYRHGMEAFPFTKERLEELHKEEKEKHEKQTLKDLLTHRDRDFVLGHSILQEQVPVDSLTGKTVGLYFSAKWCHPEQKFTPKLISVYQKIKQETENNGGGACGGFEVVFVSSDRDHKTFDAYFGTMPWLALPFNDPTNKDLTKYFDITEIPSLVILGPDGKTVTKLGRKLINLYEEKAYPFTRGRVELLEKKMDEEAKSLPESEFHVGHRHELSLVSEGNGGGAFICCDCDEQGYGWAYLCLRCGYEVHPKCVKTIMESNKS
ncbi:PREDICTED: probable nucleoredoxin 2 isoform X2 [Ipomoea nil]|uniref:probable nucleoredoxin 2 isoform X2 n=1 Tax=Ipomoea nil TaxID=35883 RepID=UPI000901CF72|nr:PREDICTED: probable nucleoredoxin 2 isoform X2 [Ipomoea nil]